MWPFDFSFSAQNLLIFRQRHGHPPRCLPHHLAELLRTRAAGPRRGEVVAGPLGFAQPGAQNDVGMRAAAGIPRQGDVFLFQPPTHQRTWDRSKLHGNKGMFKANSSNMIAVFTAWWGRFSLLNNQLFSQELCTAHKKQNLLLSSQ